MATPRWVTVGKINGLYGIHGVVKVYSYMERPADILWFDTFWLPLSGGREPFQVQPVSKGGPPFLVQLIGIEDREGARALLDTPLQVPREALETDEPEPSTYRWVDLIGNSVETIDKTPLGQVDHLIETGSNDVLVVAGPDRQRLIPFTEEVVIAIDLEAGRIRVDWDPEF